jgi:HAD superfamily hydrolase (TIGR01490 family)
MKTVLFDFDCTLTKRDTLRPIAHHLAKAYCKYWSLLFFYFIMVLKRVNMINDKGMKEFFLRSFLSGKKTEEINKLMREFFDTNWATLFNQKVLKILEDHRDKGDMVFILSANFDFLLEPLIEILGIKTFICTQTEKIDDVFTGRIIGNTYKGNSKVDRLRMIFNDHEIANMIAYGDKEDRALLSQVGKEIFVQEMLRSGE